MSTSQAEPPAASRDWLALALVALALIATFASGLRALEIVVINPRSDEGLYRAYMQRLDTHGIASFPELFEDRPGLASTDSHEAPYRVGYIALTWLAAKVCGPTFEALTYLSFACQVLLVLAVWWLGRPMFGALFAACLALALACSPLLTRLAVQPLTDSATTLSAGVAVRCLELLRGRGEAFGGLVATFARAERQGALRAARDSVRGDLRAERVWRRTHWRDRRRSRSRCLASRASRCGCRGLGHDGSRYFRPARVDRPERVHAHRGTGPWHATIDLALLSRCRPCSRSWASVRCS